MSKAFEVPGPSGMIMPVAVIFLAIHLVFCPRKPKKKAGLAS
jgi:hypothetical protein